MVVPTAADYQRQYGFALDALRMLAQRDMLAWWDDTAELSYADQRELLEAPFLAITQTYGEQAAYAAADYLFQQRSLDESLAGLEYPEVASPVDFEQAKSGYRYATWLKEYSEDPVERDVAKDKLMGVLQRLVAAPARRTVEMGVARAGTRYARLPEPGACDFCLMLASRGAVYSAKTVVGGRATTERRKYGVKIGDVAKYHDNCRCLGIEVSDGAPLPLINRQLQGAWESATKGQSDQFGAWQEYLRNRRLAARDVVEFPEIPGLKPPKYKGDGFRVVNGKREPLPKLDRLAGHVLYGWRSDRHPSQSLVLDKRFGHTAQSEQPRKTRFPSDWDDQKIVDACVEVLETGTIRADEESGRVVEGDIDGVRIRMKYLIYDGRPVQVFGYPVKSPGSGTSEVRKGGEIVWH